MKFAAHVQLRLKGRWGTWGGGFQPASRDARSFLQSACTGHGSLMLH